MDCTYDKIIMSWPNAHNPCSKDLKKLKGNQDTIDQGT